MKQKLSILCIAVVILSCNDSKQIESLNLELSALSSELDSLKQSKKETNDPHSSQIATFLTFQKGDAEQAMNFYLDLFEDSEVIELKRWGPEGPGTEGAVMHATFQLSGKLFMCSDSPAIHDWGFSPAVSNFVECKNGMELERLFTKLAEKGKVMMPLGNYGFSQRFGFVEDQFGVSWQLNLN